MSIPRVPRRRMLAIMAATAGAAGVSAVGGPAWAAPAATDDSALGTPADAAERDRLLGEEQRRVANVRGRGLPGVQVDEWVLEAQRWVNRTYGGYAGFVRAPETGRTGWSTMFALTRALQIELGLSGSQLSDTFGPTTLSLLTSRFGDIGPGKPANVVRIVQCGLYCKGYWGEELLGEYGVVTGDSVQQLRENMGFTDGRRTLAPKEFKALLTMDAYVVVEQGSAAVRAVQQWMNRTYYAQPWFFIVPCDGHGSRDVQKALIYALQTELGVSGANGTYGPGTRAAVRARAPLTVGSADTGSGKHVRLFQAAMTFNRYEVAFDGVYSSAVADQVRSFQAFVALPVNGAGDYQTWSSLLVSNGDPDRRGTACDCVSEVTPARAAALRAAGYGVVGRYLSNVPGSSLDKRIRPGELAAIFGAGLRVFPIYQTYGGSADYFNAGQGAADASAAVAAATGYGFHRGATIYFAVDYDALGADITDNVIPHFRAVRTAMGHYGNPYRIGVYGARNVCSRLLDEGLVTTSFVSDMSTGFSGNLGYPMPRNWAFDQISTISVGSGTGAIEIDNNIYSGLDVGQASVVSRPAALDTYFDPGHRPELDNALIAYSELVESNKFLLKHSERESLDVVVAYDELITNLSRSYGVRKALIQAEVYWEYWKQTPEDDLADSGVQSWYAYKRAFEAWQSVPIGPPPTPPLHGREDCSTGISQIFAATAIRARNWAVGAGLVPGPPYNGSDWHVVADVWQRLHDDGNVNISTVPLVLFENAAVEGISGPRLTYTDTELRAIFARYNGTGSEAELYGRELLGVYRVFDGFNARLR